MNHSRRSFIKWSAGSVALAALKPSWLWADEPFAGLPTIGKLKPRSSASIKASPLGVGYETLDRQHFDPVKTYQHAAQLGVKWARCQTGWARTEKTVRASSEKTATWYKNLIARGMRCGERGNASK